VEAVLVLLKQQSIRREIMSETVEFVLARAKQIASRIVSGWENGRDAYLAEIEEMKALIAGGARVIQVNHDNQDGTFGHEVEFEGKTFTAVTQEEIQLE